MKISKISTLICAAALTLSLSTFAADKKKNLEEKEANKVTFAAGLYKVADSNKVRLSVDKAAGDRLRVVVKDKAGKVYYSEMFNQKDSRYRRIFNLDEMQDGTYYFEMQSKKTKLVKEVQIESNVEKLISLQQ